MSIGEFGKDRFQGHWHQDFSTSFRDNTIRAGSGMYTGFQLIDNAGGNDLYFAKEPTRGSYGPVGIGPETNPAFVAVYVCLAY
jgi:hypothetical protein